jgi:hypothetical protein
LSQGQAQAAVALFSDVPPSSVVTPHADAPASTSQAQPDHEDESGSVVTPHSPVPSIAVPEQAGFVHNGRHYIGVAARKPVFIPPNGYFIEPPQLWIQCTCERGCYRCVYAGATLCQECMNGCYECEPGCCGMEEDVSDSCDEGAISEHSNTDMASHAPTGAATPRAMQERHSDQGGTTSAQPLLAAPDETASTSGATEHAAPAAQLASTSGAS